MRKFYPLMRSSRHLQNDKYNVEIGFLFEIGVLLYHACRHFENYFGLELGGEAAKSGQDGT